MSLVRSSASRIFLGLALVNLFVLLVAAAWLHQSRRRMAAGAVHHTQNLAHALAVSLAVSLDKLDVGLGDAAHEIEEQLSSGGLQDQRVTACLTRQKGQLRDFEGMWIADRHGDIHWGTQLPDGKPVPIADREYFQRTVASPKPDLILSKPIMGRVTQAWSIMVARRIHHPDGSLAGLVLGSLRVEDYFTRKFSEFNVGKEGRITLRDEDLALVTRYPRTAAATGQIGSRKVSLALAQALADHPLSGSFQGIPMDDHLERIYSYQKIAGYPYMVFVAQSVKEVMFPWWLEVAATLLTAAGFMVGSFLYARTDLARIQAREQADQRALAKSEARFRAIVDHSHDGIMFIDAQATILYRSPSYLAINGYRDEERIGHDAFELVHPEDQPQLRAAWQRMLANAEVRHQVQYRIRHADGLWHWVDTSVQNMLGNPDVRAVIVMSRDITREREDQESRKALEIQLNHLHRMESIGRLAGGISHDMNNVLAAIMAVTETLKYHTEGQMPQLDVILEASRRGRNLLKGLMAFARKEMEDLVSFDLNEVVRKEADILASTTLQRIRVHLDLAAGLPELTGSPSALATALMNLCVNAVDAMPAGGTLTLRTRAGAGRTVELIVEDTGDGMPPEVLKRAMEPFFTTKAVGKGTGLGLAMVFGTVQAHGGTLEIQSQAGAGTAVHITLPETGRELPAPAVVQPQPAGPDAHPIRILLVDDDQLVRMATRLLLEAQGHTVTEAEGGPQALALAEGAGVWDAAVMDLNMPELNGLETLLRLRKLKPDLPAVIITGYADEEVLRALGELDRAGLVTKPFSLRELQGALDAIV